MTKIKQFWSSQANFFVKIQGTCSKAVRRMPAPTGMEKHNCPKSRRTICKARNLVDMILEIF